jgi:uncharacterized protein YbjQ (UPF0145 family)
MPMTELSGNEIYCLAQKQYQAGNIVIGNSIYSAGYIKSLGDGIRATVGKEFKEATRILAAGRSLACQRMLDRVTAQNGHGVVKITNELIHYSGCVEFWFSGSSVKTENEQKFFATTADGQEFYALLDAGYVPVNVAFGNIVYAMGTSTGLFSGLKTLSRGEIREYSEILTQSHHAALERVISNAKEYNADALLNIKTIFSSVGKSCEMLLTGTACKHNRRAANSSNEIITSNLTNIEMWNLANLGYTPVRMLLNSVVFSLGISANINSMLKSMLGGENNQLTKLISHCRDNAINLIHEQANAMGADMVVGTKIYIFQLGNGLIEFLAMGTAVKKSPLAKTDSDQLPVQTVINDKYKFYDDRSVTNVKENTPIASLMRIVVILIIIIALVWLATKNSPYLKQETLWVSKTI